MKTQIKYDHPIPYLARFDEPEIKPGHIKLTHPEKGTEVFPTEDFTRRFQIEDENFSIVMPDESELILDPDTRHGQKGLRGCRYMGGTWDEKYLFFPSVNEALLAGATGDTTAARAAF